MRNVEPSPHVFAWAEEFFTHYAPGEDAKRLASALSGLSILTHKNKKRGSTLNFNPNGESDVTVDLENNGPPANMLERLLRTWPEMDGS
jgi:hypothetical protein